MTEEKEAILKVAEAYHQDVGRGIARVDIDTMKKLGLVSGDVIEIIGKTTVYAIVWPGHGEDIGRGILRIDGSTRSNAGIGIDDKVKIIAPTHAGVPAGTVRQGGIRWKAKYLGGHHDFGTRTDGYLVIKKDVTEFLSKSNNKIFEIPFKTIEKVEIRRARNIEGIRRDKGLLIVLPIFIISYIVSPNWISALLFWVGIPSCLLLAILKGNELVVTYKDGAGVEQSPAFTSYPGIEVDRLKSAIYNTWHKVKEEGISEREKQIEKPSAKDDILDQIQKLGELKSQGLITEEEFQKKKSELLGRL
jgi:hypothetical protein